MMWVENIVQLARTLRMLRGANGNGGLRRIEVARSSSVKWSIVFTCMILRRFGQFRPPPAQSSPPGMMESDDYALADTAKRGRLRTSIAAHRMATMGPEIIGGGGGWSGA